MTLNILKNNNIDFFHAASENPGVINMSGNNSLCDYPLGIDLAAKLKKNIKYKPEQEYYYGLPALREKVAFNISSLYGHQYCPDKEVSISAGTNQLFYAAITSLVNEGDEVIIFEPGNEFYLPVILLNGVRPVYISLKEPDFHIDWEEVTRMINSNTRMIILNTPHNPTGMTLSELDMLRLQKIITGTRIVVLSDERFEHIISDKESHQSVALYPKLVEKSILISSFNETYHVPDWNIAYCAASLELMKEIRRVLLFMNPGVYIPFQQVLAPIKDDKPAISEIGKFYQERKEYFSRLMESETRFKPVESKGTFFQLYDYKQISDENDIVFAKKMLNEIGVSVVPLSSFMHEKSRKHLLRFNFARHNNILDEVVKKLSKL